MLAPGWRLVLGSRHAISIEETPMSYPPDDPPAEPLGADQSPEAVPSEMPADAPSGDAPPLRRRRRRRRRRPVAVAVAGIEATGADAPALPAAENAAIPADAADAAAPVAARPRRRRRRRPPPAVVGETAAAAGRPDPPPSSETSADTSAQERLRPRRRRRRPSPRPATGEAGTAPVPDEEALRQAEAARRRLRVVEIKSPPRGRGPRDRRAPDGGARAEPAGGRVARAPSPRDRDARDRRPRGKGDRPSLRNAPPKRVEQKLYATRSVVDHGFEDIEAEDSATRRVTWTIVKRTLVDQTVGKPKSAVYVLERDGLETEFPNLGAARAAVNKTIVHPEKLTRSKAEYAAEKAKK
jgi:hypothetical protein